MENAIKYTPDHGKISVSLNLSDDQVTIIIADTGPGIPESEKEGIFVRFYRLDQSRNSPGSGLGLSMTKAIINLHKGSIEPESNQPGMRMVVQIPIEAPKNTLTL